MENGKQIVLPAGVDEEKVMEFLKNITPKPKTQEEISNEVITGKRPFITFSHDGKEYGSLWIKDGIFSFKGDCQVSADVFFKNVEQMLNEAFQKSLDYQLNKRRG